MPSSIPARDQRTVLVTGAARRLGREIALALAAGGWRVAVHYRHSKDEAMQTVADCTAASGQPDSCAAFPTNLDNEVEVRALLSQVVAHFGRVDAVVNSASLFEHDTALTFSPALLEQHLRSNTIAPILLAQALHAHVASRQAAAAPQNALRDAAAAVVVNLLDQKLWNPNPDFLSYTLSKAALESANTLLALALAPHVRVVGVAPGLTLTSHLLDDKKFAQLHSLSPLGRSSTAADVAATVKFALENRSITGTTLLVDGGQHLMRFDRDFSMM
jgi:NAD(P)-dependent dehydrogenase (short-subunit alcohol dehydrogenase family)